MTRRGGLGLLAVAVLGVACAEDASAPTIAPTATTASPSTSTGAATTHAPTRTAPSATTTAPSSTAPPTTRGVVPEGFDTVAARAMLADGTVCELCLWRADDPGERATGLMGVTDLGGADGMVFLYDEPTGSQFWMRDTLIPLAIVFFGADGTFVSSAEMIPCADGTDCTRYPPAAPFTAAVELPAGEVVRLGIGPGTVLTVLEPDCLIAP